MNDNTWVIDYEIVKDCADDGPEVDILRALQHGYVPEWIAFDTLEAIQNCRRDGRG